MANKRVPEGFRLVLGKLLANSCTTCVKLVRAYVFKGMFRKLLFRTSLSVVLVVITRAKLARN